jgi:hypothetical protein
MLNPTVHRMWSGIQVIGEQFSIALYPSWRGTLSVVVTAYPPVSGFDRAVRIGESERRYEFRASEIVVADNRMDCFAPSEYAPFFHEGFWLTLEPGMAPYLRNWIPQLAVAANACEALESAISAKLFRNVDYLMDFAGEIVARIVLDGQTPQDVTMRQKECGHSCAGWADLEFVAQFKQEYVLQTLDDAYSMGAVTRATAA